VDGELVHPRIGVGTITGRVTYTDPALQTMPKSDRLTRLAPVVAGRRFVRADFGQIEPRILLKILQRCGLIAWEAGDDLYRTLCGDAIDRDTVKVTVNTLMNGGSPPAGATGRLAEFIRAVNAYRNELAAIVRSQGFVFTMDYRIIPLANDESNYAGKCVNYLVQGTAADIFNQAVLRVDAALKADGLAAAVAFLLYDEMWVETDSAIERQVVALIRREMEATALALGVMVPVRIDDDLVPGAAGPDERVEQETLAPDTFDERAAIMEFDGGLPREAAERLAGAPPTISQIEDWFFPWEATP
jgi:DNA polymerase-1